MSILNMERMSKKYVFVNNQWYKIVNEAPALGDVVAIPVYAYVAIEHEKQRYAPWGCRPNNIPCRNRQRNSRVRNSEHPFDGNP